MKMDDSHISSHPNPQRISSLQTMRLIAAVGIFQFHLWENYLGVTLAFPATDYFLVLVGVLAAMAQADRIAQGSWWGYMKARYTRLYVTFIPLFLLTLIWKWQDADWEWVLRSFFLIPIADRTPVIGATWMLSLFLLFYLLFSSVYLFRTETALWLVFGVWAFGIVAFNWFHWNPGIPAHWARTLFYERNLEFVFGYAAGVLLRQRRLKIGWSRVLFWLGTLGIGGSILLQNNGVDSLGRSLYSGIPVTLFVLGLTSLEQQGAPDRVVRLLTLPWLVLAGESSYVLYLSHGIFLQGWDRIFSVTPLSVPMITLVMIGVSVIGYSYWEKPMIHYLNKRVWTFPKFPSLPKLVKTSNH